MSKCINCFIFIGPCSSLISLNDCEKINLLSISHDLNIINVNNMSCMFYNCSSLTSLNLSNFNTNNVINMSNMFYKCSSLTSLKTIAKRLLKEWKLNYFIKNNC